MWFFVLYVTVDLFPPLCIAVIEWRMRKLSRSFTMSYLELAHALLHQIKLEHETNADDNHPRAQTSLMEVLAECPQTNPTT